MTQGERIFIYTDDVNEATDKNNQLYCENHHLETVYRKNVKKPQKLCRAVNNDVNAFVGEAPQFDYITMKCAEILRKNMAAVKCYFMRIEQLRDLYTAIVFITGFTLVITAVDVMTNHLVKKE